MPISDKEQQQIVRFWWQRYGYYIVLLLLIFVATSFGWLYWQRYQHVHLEHASIIYVQMLAALEQKKGDELKLFGDNLIKKYSRSTYASLAALILAKHAVQAGDLKAAEEKLKFVINDSPSNALRQLARIRIARILIELKKPQEALDLLKLNNGNYASEVSEIAGDAFLALGVVEEAEKAYRKSQYINVSLGKSVSPLLKIKMQRF